jgi:ABC-type multidrug transport system permease subunit
VNFTKGSGTSADFLFWIPGMCVFGWCFVGLVVSLLLAREIRRGTFERLRPGNISVSQLVIGLWLCQAFWGAAQLGLSLGLATALGFASPAPTAQLVIVGFGLSLFMSALGVAIGLITTAFLSSEAAAANGCFVLILPLAFLSGSMFPLAFPPVVQLGSWQLSLVDLGLPSAPALRLLADTLVRAQPLVWGWPGWLLLGAHTAMWLAVGAALFRFRRLAWFSRR